MPPQLRPPAPHRTAVGSEMDITEPLPVVTDAPGPAAAGSPSGAPEPAHAPSHSHAHSDAHAHAHAHAYDAVAPADRRVRLLLAALLGPAGLAALVGLVLLWPPGHPPAPTPAAGAATPVHAQVIQTRAARCDDSPGGAGPAVTSSGAGAPGSGAAAGDADASAGGCVALLVHLTDGPRAGRDLVQLVPVEPSTSNKSEASDTAPQRHGGDHADR